MGTRRRLVGLRPGFFKLSESGRPLATRIRTLDSRCAIPFLSESALDPWLKFDRELTWLARAARFWNPDRRAAAPPRDQKAVRASVTVSCPQARNDCLLSGLVATSEPLSLDDRMLIRRHVRPGLARRQCVVLTCVSTSCCGWPIRSTRAGGAQRLSRCVAIRAGASRLRPSGSAL